MTSEEENYEQIKTPEIKKENKRSLPNESPFKVKSKRTMSMGVKEIKMLLNK